MARRAPGDAPGRTVRSDRLGGLTRALLDTSVVISSIAAAPPADSAEDAVSVLTFGELLAGMLRAVSPGERGVRAARLSRIRAVYEGIPVDEEIARAYGRALARARDEGRIQDAADLLILATAWATGRTLLTRDRAQAGLAETLGVAFRLVE